MLELKSIQAMHFEAELYESSESQVGPQVSRLLCSSGPVSLRDDDWVCLSTLETAAGDLHKLLNRIWQTYVESLNFFQHFFSSAFRGPKSQHSGEV